MSGRIPWLVLQIRPPPLPQQEPPKFLGTYILGYTTNKYGVDIKKKAFNIWLYNKRVLVEKKIRKTFN